MVDYGYLQDSEGNKSSKRLWGSILLSYAILLTAIAFGYSLFKVLPGDATVRYILEFLYFGGAGLLGIGIAEPFFMKKQEVLNVNNNVNKDNNRAGISGSNNVPV